LNNSKSAHTQNSVEASDSLFFSSIRMSMAYQY